MITRCRQVSYLAAVLCLLAWDYETANGSQSISLRWNVDKAHIFSTISSDAKTMSWGKNTRNANWVCAETTERLSNGIYEWNFDIQTLGEYYIGVGFLIEPIDWGSRYHLGSGLDAWAYDPFKGAIVTDKKAKYSGLPIIQGAGVVSVRVDLINMPPTATFSVDGIATPEIDITTVDGNAKNLTILPAACLLKKGQMIKISDVEKIQ